jgi:hypothetical protein
VHHRSLRQGLRSFSGQLPAPHLEALPQHEGEKADEDMYLPAILALVLDRTTVELVLLDKESGFGLRQLDIGLPVL